MRINNFVYLDKKANRLIIVQEPVDNKDFIKLMDNNGIYSFNNREVLLQCCKMFCIGFIIGTDNKKPINDLNEFK